MQYIFEDNENSLLGKLFRKAYPESVVKNFHYTKGNSKITKYITTTLKPDEEITVFIDMPPGNPDVVSIYRKIGELTVEYTNLMVYPLLCMEYYFLKFIQDSHLVTMRQWVDICLSFGLMSETSPPILESEDEVTDYTTYENFCKLVSRKALAQCARIGVLSKQEDRNRPFFTEDCLCKTRFVNSQCQYWSCTDKSEAFTRQLPARPAFHNKEGEYIATREDRVALHRRLVAAYNELSASMREKDVLRKELYLKIEPLV